VSYRLPYSAEGPELSCVPANPPLALEAGFDSEAWQQSHVVTEFWESATPGALAVPLQARFAYDSRSLYAIIRIAHMEGRSPSDEDMIELAVYKDGRAEPPSFQFAFNARGRIPGRFAWNTPYAKGRTTRDPDGGWTVSTDMLWLQLDVMNPTPDTFLGIGITHVQSPEGEDAKQVGPPAVFRYGRLVLK